MTSALPESMRILTPPSSAPVAIALSDLGEDLAAIGGMLADEGYRFTSVTPATHARVMARGGPRVGSTLRDIFGWNLPFIPGVLPHALRERLEYANLLHEDGGLLRSRVRFASVGNRLYAHDSYPTTAPDAVFFGPDSYRFLGAVHRLLRPSGLVVDLCSGSGVGGLEIVGRHAGRVVLADINPRAVAFAAANLDIAARHHDIDPGAVTLWRGDLLNGFDEQPDAIIANPPYLADPLARTYRDGGGLLGIGLALRIVEESLARLAPGGQLVLYTGTPIIGGIDRFAAAARPLIHDSGAEVTYEEVDPDVFGEELSNPAYAAADRIAAVVLSLTLPA